MVMEAEISIDDGKSALLVDNVRTGHATNGGAPGPSEDKDELGPPANDVVAGPQATEQHFQRIPV